MLSRGRALVLSFGVTVCHLSADRRENAITNNDRRTTSNEQRILMKILLTNDDGINSPALVAMARAMQSLGDLRVVVPSGERSWIGKAITRHGVLDVKEEVRGGIKMLAVGGTPADCVNLAVHTLDIGKPDLVISGINLGLNYSLAFLISSGTVGAAIEAWICGIPSIAFSMGLPSDAWGVTDQVRASAIEECAQTTSMVSRSIVDDLLAAGYPPEVDTISVNMGAHAKLDTRRVVAGVTRSRYGRLFVSDGNGGYVHRFENLWALDEDERGDMAVVDRGEVAITPLRLDVATRLSPELTQALERGSDRKA